MRLHYNLNQESSRLPVQLLDEGFIRSVEPGKATIVVEGKSFEHQEVFINVIVVPVYSLALEKPYVPLSIPLGSETKINIILQENNGRSFMQDIEGISLTLENSHPQYVRASFDVFNQSLSLFGQNIGEANIKVIYSNETFDVIRARVVSSIRPVSPVHVHQGAKIQFVYDEMSSNAYWESQDP